MILFFFTTPPFVPPSDEVVIPPPYGDVFPVDHAATAQQRILEQFKFKTNVKGFIFAQAPQYQALENTLFDLLSKRWLHTAVGAQLDGLGEILDLERQGVGDDDYRLRLRAQMLVYRSSGTVEHIYRIFTLLEPTADFGIDDVFPASFLFTWTDPPLGSADATRYALLLKRSRAAGIGAWFYYYPAPEAELFSFAALVDTVDSAANGFADDAQTIGGKFAGILES